MRLVAVAIALLAMMMLGPCVAEPDQAAPETDLTPPEPEGETQLELDDNEDFDPVNIGLIEVEDDLFDQLTEMDDEDSLTLGKTSFKNNCTISSSKTYTYCDSIVMFTALGTTFRVKVRVYTNYYKLTHRLRFRLVLNNKCIGKVYASGAADKPQTMCKPYIHKKVRFDACLKASRLFTDMNGKRIYVCSNVKIKSSNKTWATTQRRCFNLKTA